MVIAELDDVQYDLEVDGELVRRQLERKVWEHRGRATIAVKFEERASDGTWKEAKIALLRFAKAHEVWKKEASLTLSTEDAAALAATITAWCS